MNKRAVSACVALFLMVAAGGRLEGVAAGPEGRPEQLFLMVAAGGRLEGDLERMQGTWICTSMERNGRAIPAEEYRDGLLVIEGEKFTYTLRGRLIAQGTRKLDASQTPKAFDDTHAAGTFAGRTYLGIYELDGDTLRTCNGSRGQRRPTTFASRPLSGLLLATYKRVDPATRR